jgi:protein-L-isoaspartate(D-aspartate) O-methyltransferase
VPAFADEPSNHDELVLLIDSEDVSPRVVDAFRAIDRKWFVPEEARDNAYVDRPIEILEHQTTSQPSLIARMVDAADLLPGDRVLEIGTGFGFQTALLAQLTGSVVSVERLPNISAAASNNLIAAGIDGVELVVGDGWLGWPRGGPYEAIVVSAAAAHVPAAFVEQLRDGGRLIIPVRGERGDDVFLYVKSKDHLVNVKLLTPARFVPLVPGDAVQSNE